MTPGPRAAVHHARLRALGVIHAECSAASAAPPAQPHRRLGQHVLITMERLYRAGQLTDHKVKADEALIGLGGHGRSSKSTMWAGSGGAIPVIPSQTPMAGG